MNENFAYGQITEWSFSNPHPGFTEKVTNLAEPSQLSQ